MAVRAKATKPAYRQVDVEEVISRGGKTVAESSTIVQDEAEELRFTLRIPTKYIDQLDNDRKKRVGNVSRNQWILEAIAEQLKQ